MQLALPQLPTHLQKGLRNLYVVHGDEALLAQEALDSIRALARTQGYTERTVYMVQGAHFDWTEVLASGASLSLFADKQIVEVRIPSGKPGKEGSLALQELAANAADNDTTLTLVQLPRLDKATKSSAWFAALENHGVSIQIESIERRALPQWIAARLQAQGQRVQAGEMGQHSLQFFADRVEGNLLAAHQEIQKLALLYEPGELSFEQIESAVLDVARYDVFKLTEAVLGGQMHRVQRMMDGLQAEGVAAVLVHWTLAEDIRAIKRIQDATLQGKPLAMTLRENRIWGTKEMLMQRVLPRISAAQASHLLESASVVDGVIKGLKHPEWPANPWDALHSLAIRFAQLCVLPRTQTAAHN
jgi:DNA polymerase III subunit delta